MSHRAVDKAPMRIRSHSESHLVGCLPVPGSFEIVSFSPRGDSGKVRRTLLRDERATWLKEGRDFRIVPSPGSKAAE